MSRGELDNATLAMISQQLPPVEELDRIVSDFSPDIISTQFQPDSTIPDAAVCLQDTVNALAEARYALHEAPAHKIWYLEKAEPKNEFGAVFFSRFYMDDVALRICEIVHGKQTIDADTALRLSRYFDLPEGFWLDLQARYDREIEKDRLKHQLEQEVPIYGVPQ